MTEDPGRKIPEKLLSVCLEHWEETLKSNNAGWKKNFRLGNMWESVCKNVGASKGRNTKPKIIRLKT